MERNRVGEDLERRGRGPSIRGEFRRVVLVLGAIVPLLAFGPALDAAPAVTALEPDLPPEVAAVQVRQTRLELRLRLDYEEGALDGEARIAFVNESDRPASEIELNLNRLMRVRSATGPDGPSTFAQDLVAFVDRPRWQVSHVVVTLPKPLPPGASSWIELGYGGFLVGYTETGSLYIQDRIAEEFSILRTDALAFPELGSISRTENRKAPRGDFDYRVEIDVPEGQVVASAGRLEAHRRQAGRSLWIYESEEPAPFLNVPIAPYEVLEDEGVRVYCFPADREGALEVMEKTREALAVLGDWFGPLDRASRVTVMEIPEGWGSQASLSGGIIQTADVFRDPSYLAALYHELSHLWNAPDLERPSARWNEGLATYLQTVLAERLDGWEGRDAYLERAADRLLARIDDAGGEAIPFADYGRHERTDWSYATGLLFFQVLERTMGRDALLAALREHYQAHKETGTTFADLEATLRRHSDQDLGRVLEDWVHTTAWLARVRQRESVEAVAEYYRRAAP